MVLLILNGPEKIINYNYCVPKNIRFNNRFRRFWIIW